MLTSICAPAYLDVEKQKGEHDYHETGVSQVFMNKAAVHQVILLGSILTGGVPKFNPKADTQHEPVKEQVDELNRFRLFNGHLRTFQLVWQVGQRAS